MQFARPGCSGSDTDREKAGWAHNGSGPLEEKKTPCFAGDQATGIRNTYLLIYLLTYLLTHSLTYLLTQLLTYILTYLLTYLRTYLLTYLLTSLLPYSLTYLLTPWSRVLLQKLTGYAASQEVPTFYRTRIL